MAKRLFLSKVEEVFNITGVGIVIIPGVPFPSATIPVVRVGDTLVLVRPDGSELRTAMKEIEMITRKDRSKPATHAPFVVAADITKQDVPPGTEVWLCE